MLVGGGVVRLEQSGDRQTVTATQDLPRPHTPEPHLLRWLDHPHHAAGYLCVPGERRCYPEGEYNEDGTLRRHLLPSLLASLWALPQFQSVAAELSSLYGLGTRRVLVRGGAVVHDATLYDAARTLWNLSGLYPQGAAIPVHLVRAAGAVSVSPAVHMPDMNPHLLSALLAQLQLSAEWLPDASQPDAIRIDGDRVIGLSDLSRPGSPGNTYLGYLLPRLLRGSDPFGDLLPTCGAPDTGVQCQLTALLSP